MYQDLQGKKALVTGAAGGIGQAIVKGLQESGVQVASADKKLSENLGNAQLIGDLADKSYCDSLPQAAFEALGGLDILINNAGVIPRGVITDMRDEDYDLVMDINVKAPFRLCRAAIPLLEKNGGGAIVNTASCWGLYPGPNHPLYCMSKAALASLTQCLARDHAHQAIRINAVCPNEVNTNMLRSGFTARRINPDKAISELNASVPLGRIAEPEDIADVAIFLASDKARYMCGALLEVNGAKAVQ